MGISDVRASWWALRAARRARRDLAGHGLDELVVTPPPPLPEGSRRWASASLKASRQTCLVRSMVLQAWDASHGRRRDLVIGVTSPRQGFRAHAWLEGDPVRTSRGFSELSRRPAPGSPESQRLGTSQAEGGSGGDGCSQTVEEERKVGPVP